MTAHLYTMLTKLTTTNSLLTEILGVVGPIHTDTTAIKTGVNTTNAKLTTINTHTDDIKYNTNQTFEQCNEIRRQVEGCATFDVPTLTYRWRAEVYE